MIRIIEKKNNNQPLGGSVLSQGFHEMYNGFEKRTPIFSSLIDLHLSGYTPDPLTKKLMLSYNPCSLVRTAFLLNQGKVIL